MGNDNKLSLLLLNKGGDSVDTLTNNQGALGRSISFALSTLLGTSPEPLLLGKLALRSVLVKQLEHLSGCKIQVNLESDVIISINTCLTVQSLTELVDWWGDLQTLDEDSLLALEADVLGPADKPAEIPLGLDILTYMSI